MTAACIRRVLGMTARARTSAVAGVALALTLAGCGSQPAPVPAAHDVAADATFVSPLSQASIYDLDLDLVDADATYLTLADLRGQTMVASMVYTSCTSVCPRVTEDMKAVERLLSEDAKHHVTFALFSLDPGRDTPAAMKQFAVSHGLAPERWRLFAASEDGGRDLSAVFGVKYRRDTDGEIAHSAMIFVIDPAGVVRHRQVGLSQDPTALVKAVSGD
ncbi:MAG: SCO family protein [Acidobacteria bacterium]|nr:SCO family protein [Acidobacteriota bacterium]